MSALEKFAALLKAKKGIGSIGVKPDPPATPEQPAPPTPKRANGRPRFSPGQHLLLKLESQAREATRRAATAERAIEQHAKRSRDAAEALHALRAAHALALARIAQLEEDNERLRGEESRDAVWQAVRLALQKLLLERPEPGTVSRRALADHLGVHKSVVTLWLRGNTRPRPETQQRIEEWIKSKGGTQ